MAEAKVQKKHYLGTGRRKTAVARVRLFEGSGQITINGRSLEQYFTEDKDRNAVVGPLMVTETRSRVDVTVRTDGGGFSGQSGAICQGVARALKSMFGLETKGALATPEPWLLDLFGAAPASSGIAVTPRIAMTCAPVRRAVQLISESIGQLPVHVYERGDDSAKERAPDHPAYRGKKAIY